MVRYIRYGLYFLKHCLASYSYHKPYQQNSWLSYRHPAMMAKQLLVHWPIHIRTWLCVSPTCQEKFYNIWVISRMLIGWELWSIRAQTMGITWWWCNLFFTSSRTQLSKNLEPEMDIKNHQKRTAEKWCQCSKLCSTLVLNILTLFLW